MSQIYFIQSVWVYLCLIAEEAGVRVLGEVCRGTAGSCSSVYQHLSACSQGKDI